MVIEFHIDADVIDEHSPRYVFASFNDIECCDSYIEYIETMLT